MVGEEGWEQVGGHERVGVGDEWSWFREDRGLGGGLDGDGGLHLSPVEALAPKPPTISIYSYLAMGGGKSWKYKTKKLHLIFVA